MPDGAQVCDRSIQIQENVIGSILTTGDGNVINATIQVIHPASGAREDVTSAGSNPYKGLACFKEGDAEYYFGREAQVERLHQRFQALFQYPSALRILPVLGPSGCGKSSLVRAGLIPALARTPLPGKENLQVIVIQPGERPLASLAGGLARLVTGDATPVEKTAELERVLRQPNDAGEFDGLQRIIDLVPDSRDAPVVLVIDQFEEIYSLCKQPQARQIFIDGLLYAAGKTHGNVAVVITLRSDFMGETQQHGPLNEIVMSDTSLLVPVMKSAELRRAILEPARRAGRSLDGIVVDWLVGDTEGREGALPLLQFALTRIWSEMNGNRSVADIYWAMGGVGGALAERAQEVYESLTNLQKKVVARLFIELVELGENGRYTRRPVKLQELVTRQEGPDLIKETIQAFAQPGVRLLTLYEQNHQEVAEVTHEALFEYWQQLRVWLDQNQDEIRFQRRLDAAIRRWQKHHRPEGLLWRSYDLDRLKQSVANWRGDLKTEQSEFFRACLALERKQKLLKWGAWAAVGMVTGLSWLAAWRIQQEKQVTEAVFLGYGETVGVVANLPRLKARADALRNRLDVKESFQPPQAALEHYQAREQDFKRLFAYYRNIITTVERLSQDADLDKTLGDEAETALAELMIKYRLPQLEQDLSQPAFGEFLQGVPNPEQRYSEGALRTTYEILMTDSGAGADLNYDGFIGDPQEAQQLPCDLLAKIERLWRQATEQTCGWYTVDGHFARDYDCQVLDENFSTLYMSIFLFGEGPAHAIDRIQGCGIQPG